MSESPTKDKIKVANSSEDSKKSSKGNRREHDRSAVGRLGAFFNSHWYSSFYIAPVVLAISLFLLFFLKKSKGVKE